MPIIDGQVRRARYTSLKLNELSAVDRPAQPGALATIMKRAPDAEPSLIALAVAKYIGSDDGAHTFEEVLSENKFSEAIWPMTDALSQSIRSIVGDTSLDAASREAKITASVEEFLSAVRDIEPDVEKRLAELISKKETTMPKTVEQLEADLAKANSQIAALTTERDAALAKANAADVEKDKAVAEAAESKKALVAATDEVIKVADTEVRKSEVGDASFKLTKALADERDMARLEKRAETDFRHLPGTTTEKALVLKHVDAMPEEAKKAAEAIMTSAEKMVAMGFQTFGSRGGEYPTNKVAEQGFMTKVHEIAKRDNIGQAAAMSKARTEFPEEFSAYQDGGLAN